MAERRRHPRVRASLPLRVRIDEVSQFTEHHSADLSAGGIFVRMDSPPPLGTDVDVQFHFTQQKRTICVRGRVVRCVPRATLEWEAPGAGIQFTRIDDVARRFIELAVETYRHRHPSQELELPEGFFEEIDREAGGGEMRDRPADQPKFLSAVRVPDTEFLEDLDENDLQRVARSAKAYPEQVRTRARRLLKLRKDRGQPEP